MKARPSHPTTASLVAATSVLLLPCLGAEIATDRFNAEDDIAPWSAIWGTSPTLEFSTLDAKGAATSGSLKISADYFTPEDSGWEQMVVSRSFETPIVGKDYASVSIDVRVDPSSVPARGGVYGYFELKRTTDGSPFGGVNLTSTNWQTITFKLAPTEGTLNGIIIQNGNGGFQGPITLQVDNLVFTERVTTTAAPPLRISRNDSPGLKLIASAPGQAYQRQNIVFAPSEDLNNQLWWVNQPDPVTYSITWSSFPDAPEHTGFQGHLMLVTDTSGAITPDWNDANAILVEFQYFNSPGADGQNGTDDDRRLARARFLHKVNEPGANGMLYRTADNAAAGPVGVLGEVLAPSMLGTWSVTLRNNRDITLTAPDGNSTSLTMPESDASAYEPTSKGVSALFGIQPNADARIGLSATVSRIKITRGTQTVVDDTFAGGELDPARWTARAQDPSGIFIVSPDIAYLIHWDLPDAGYALAGGSTVTGPRTAVGTPTLVGAQRFVLLNKSALPGAGSGFFRLDRAAR